MARRLCLLRDVTVLDAKVTLTCSSKSSDPHASSFLLKILNYAKAALRPFDTLSTFCLTSLPLRRDADRGAPSPDERCKFIRAVQQWRLRRQQRQPVWVQQHEQCSGRGGIILLLLQRRKEQVCSSSEKLRRLQWRDKGEGLFIPCSSCVRERARRGLATLGPLSCAPAVYPCKNEPWLLAYAESFTSEFSSAVRDSGLSVSGWGNRVAPVAVLRFSSLLAAIGQTDIQW